MFTYFTGSLYDVFKDPTLEATIIVPVTDNGIIQDTTIRTLSTQYPEILTHVLTYCSGRQNGLISYYLNNECNTQLVFISCISTKNGLCELLREVYIKLLDRIIGNMSRTLRYAPSTYLVEPIVNGSHIFDSTIEDIMSLSSEYGVGLNYVIPSSIL